ncbi:hypothetical protein H6P81_005944 [Aristolochia fimbriata]|uniref:Putative plant transposon protein domain-containing protein n=1 Tax=Aristolochia fimbriata TaxID=158543 RepID=A0AAV7EY29_ARIFI|nr:hypothetical protein H6P81_005944 [Aristolochia fimbriata]
MKADAWLWAHFLFLRVRETSHLTEITYDKGRILYAFLEGIHINVKGVIHASIMKQKERPTTLPFPHLISGLCIEASIIQDKDEVMVPPEKPITPYTYSRIFRPQKHVSTSRDKAEDSKRLRIEAELKSLRDEEYKFSEKNRLIWRCGQR